MPIGIVSDHVPVLSLPLNYHTNCCRYRDLGDGRHGKWSDEETLLLMKLVEENLQARQVRFSLRAVL